MNFEALDGTRLTILMIAGAVFAAVGLYLLLKPKTASTAKIEFFGLKFESSSAGLLVFLIGAAFLALPLFVPERMGASTKGVGGKSTAEKVQPSEAKTAVSSAVLPATADATEAEPNNSRETANLLSLETNVSGALKPGNRDWYVIPVSLPPDRKMEFRLQNIGDHAVTAQLFDAREQLITTFVASVGAQYREVFAGNEDRFYAKLFSKGGTVYEFSVVALSGD